MKVTCLKSMAPLERYGHKEHMPNMNAQSLIVRKLMANVQIHVKIYVTIGKALS